MKTILAAAVLAGLLGCSTTPEPQDVIATDQLTPQTFHWSAKTTGYVDADKDISVVMNSWGLLYLKIDGKIVVQRHNWCVMVQDQP